MNEEVIEEGVRQAVASGELDADAPVDEIAAMISVVVHFASLISQAPHDIGRLKQTYQALQEVIAKAYSRSVESKDGPVRAATAAGSRGAKTSTRRRA